jgi:hypothetical protein
VVVTGLENSLADRRDMSQWYPFIYAIDSATKLGFNDPNAPFVIGDRFVLYPSPATTELTIEHMTGKGFSYVVYDMMGRLVTKCTATQSKQKLDVSNYAQGHYNVLVADDAGYRKTLRFVR